MNASMCLLECVCECEHVSVRVCACFMIVLYYFEGNIVNRIIFIYIYIYVIYLHCFNIIHMSRVFENTYLTNV